MCATIYFIDVIPCYQISALAIHILLEAIVMHAHTSTTVGSLYGNAHTLFYIHSYMDHGSSASALINYVDILSKKFGYTYFCLKCLPSCTCQSCLEVLPPVNA